MLILRKGAHGNDSAVFVGYDTRKVKPVCEYGIKRLFEKYVLPLWCKMSYAKKIYWRETWLASTEFAFTRFLIPRLMDHKGWAYLLTATLFF